MPDNKRLNEFLVSKGVHTKDLAQNLGITHGAVSSLRSGRNKMSFETLKKVLELYPDLCANWLLRGEGQPNCQKNILTDSRQEILVKEQELEMLRKYVKVQEELIDFLKKNNAELVKRVGEGK
ncbi:MAG: helix-turn-helix transcriptional regulator [Bacteroidales bacterium]|jgi:DNA-binding Xre family transcriptional regulator